MRKAQERKQQRGKAQRGDQDRGTLGHLGEIKTWPLLDLGPGHYGSRGLEVWGLGGAAIQVT